MAKVDNILIRPDAGVTIAGKRGCGKTTLARHILKQIPRKAIYDPLGQYADMNSFIPKTFNIEEFDYFAAQCWVQGDIFVAVEECENWIGQTGKRSPEFMRIINMGRNRGMGYMVITRRLANVDKTAVGLSDHVFLYKLFLPNDVKYCEDFLTDEWAGQLPKLGKYEYLYYADGETVKCPPIKL